MTERICFYLLLPHECLEMSPLKTDITTTITAITFTLIIQEVPVRHEIRRERTNQNGKEKDKTHYKSSYVIPNSFSTR